MVIFRGIMEIILEGEITQALEVSMAIVMNSSIMMVILLKLFVRSVSYLDIQPIGARIGTIHLLFHRKTMAEVM